MDKRKLRRGQTYEQIYGAEKAKELKENLSKRFSGDKNPAKTPEAREKIRIAKIKEWADPNSKHNTKKYRDLRSKLSKKWLMENPHPQKGKKLSKQHIELLLMTRTEKMKELWADSDSVFNSEKYRKKLRKHSSKFVQHHIVPRELGGKKTIKLNRKEHSFVELHLYRKILYDLVRDYVPQKTIERRFEIVFSKWRKSIKRKAQAGL